MLFSCVKFDSLLGRNQVYGACCSAQTDHKPVQQSGKQALRAYCPDIYSGTTCDNDLLSAYRAMGLGQGAKNKIVYFIQGNKS